VRALPGQASRQPPGPAPVTREAAAADQRRRILASTAKLVAEHGYQETTIEMIVRRARVGYATFYKHYPDKEAAFLALLEAATKRTAERAEAAYEHEEGPWGDRVRAALESLFQDVVDHPEVARACLVDSLSAGEKAVELHEAALRRLAALLRPGRELDPARAASFNDRFEETLAGGVLWVLNQRLLGGEVDEIRRLLAETLEFLLRPYVGEEEEAVREASDLAAEAPAA
jgi:AcrR family transcriptional regulator